ncbi:MAG: hypothetical protein K5622_00055 [Endomicrobiaceae bacterium]|nr:hypothetical protein [Endomicrobiaceae bacterium]
MKKLLAIIGFLFCFSLSYAGLSIDPSVTNIAGEPGSVYDGKYLVKNTYDKKINVTVAAEKGNCFSANKDVELDKWLSFEKDKYSIQAGETVEVPYSIKIGEDFKGSVSARITFSVDQEQGQIITISISVPIYITVIGTENIDFCIDSLDLYSAGKNIAYKLVLENKGNVHIRHSGNIEIYTKKKKKLLKNIQIQETVPTYCEQKREFSEPFLSNTSLKKGKYVAVFKIKALGKEVTKEVNFKISKKGEITVKK